MSGGLDSMLVSKILERLGFEVHAVNFYTGFCIVEQRRRVDGSVSSRNNKKLINPALKSAAEIEVPVEIIDISKEYLAMVTHPKFGYGSNVNPCIDCRIHMLREAKAFMDRIGAKFIATGEVVGQRPMSQHKNTMRLIEKEAGVADLVLRPLSARLLPPTIPEIKGWVKRQDLYDIYGRGRGRQMKLASELGIADYPNPAGGCCFLTDQTYACRFFDLMRHRDEKVLTMEDVVRLRLGRHFRMSPDFKIIIGRNESENELLEQYAETGMALVAATEAKGPVALVEGRLDDNSFVLAARLTAGYGKSAREAAVDFTVRIVGGDEKRIVVEPADPKEYEKHMIIHDPGARNKVKRFRPANKPRSKDVMPAVGKEADPIDDRGYELREIVSESGGSGPLDGADIHGQIGGPEGSGEDEA